MITHYQPTVTEEAVRGGFLDPLRTEGVLRLARDTRLQRQGLLPVVALSLGMTAGLGTDEFVLHAIGEIEATRRRIVVDARLLSKPA